MPTTTSTSLRCRFCHKPTKSPTGKAAHERYCTKNPDHLTSGPKVGVTLERLAEWAKTQDTFTKQDAATFLGLSTQGAASVMSKLQHQGVLMRVSLGRYRLAKRRGPNRNGTTRSRWDDAALVEAVRTAGGGQPVKSGPVREILGVPNDNTGAFSHAMRRAVKNGVLVNVAFGLYTLPKGKGGNGNGNGHGNATAHAPQVVALTSARRSIQTQLADDVWISAAVDVLFPKGLGGVQTQRLIEWIDVTREFLRGE